MITFITWFFSPFTIGLLLVAWIARHLWRQPDEELTKAKKRRVLALTMGWLICWSQPLMVNTLGMWLESSYPFVAADAQPVCDAIVLLGGGMGAPQRSGMVPEMYGAADRVWHAARLWHAGRGRYIIASGGAEAASSVILLKDLGVPAGAIVVEGRASNTVENGVYVRQLIDKRHMGRNVLLVTSAWHMRRAMMIFRSAGLHPVPAAVDHEATSGGWCQVRGGGVRLAHLLPNAQAFAMSGVYVKECQGLAGDWFRVRRAKKKALPSGD